MHVMEQLNLLRFAEMVGVEGLQVLNEKMKTMEHGENEIYKFLGVEQADGINIKEVSHRAEKMYIIVEKFSRRMNIITKTKLNFKNVVAL